MSLMDEILAHNRKFVENKEYANYDSTKYPNKKLAILSCMDTRLTELLPAAMNFKNGDIKIIKNAGAVITHPFGSVMRSLLIAIYELNVNEIAVIGHHDCGMQSLEPARMLQRMLDRGITREQIDMIEYCGANIGTWLQGFDNAEKSVRETLNIIRKHPLIPEDVRLYGFLIDPTTGKLDKVSAGK